MSIDPDQSSDDAEARRDAARTIAVRLAVWGVPVLGLAILCLLLGLPWWLVTAGIVLFVGVIVFEA